jgi:hypothetical protein
MKNQVQNFFMIALAVLCSCTEQDLIAPAPKSKLATATSETKTHVRGKAFTIGAVVIEGSTEFRFFLGANGSSEISVSWGDGTTSTHVVSEAYTTLAHNYSQPGNYPVNITGDLRKIVSFNTSYYAARFNSISFAALPALESVSIFLTSGSSVLDLSKNFRLTSVSVVAVEGLETLILPERHTINDLGFMGPSSWITTEAVDAIIDNIYSNAVKRKIFEGNFFLNADYIAEDGSIIGPPSATSMAKLRILKDEYHWFISPYNLFDE